MKKIFLSLILLVTTIVLVACNNDGSNPDDTDAKAKTIIVYTNQTSGGRGAQLENLVKEQKFDFEVIFVELSGQNLKNRLVAEKNAPIADVVLGGGITEHIELKDEGVTTPYTPKWIDEVEDSVYDLEHYYTPWAVEPLYLVYNKKYYSSDANSSLPKAPTSYEDLAVNFKGKYNVFKPSSGSGSTIYAAILSKYRQDNGELNVSDAGWDLLSELINNGVIDNGLWQANLAGSRHPIAMTWAGAIIDIEYSYDVELGIVEMEEGAPTVVSQVAVVNSKNQPRINAAREFIDWWGSAEAQVEWSKISGQAPANKIAFEQVDETVKGISATKAQDLDWGFIAKNASSWRQKIELDIIK